MNPTTRTRPNGIDLEALDGVVRAIEGDADLAKACIEIETVWQGQTRSESRTREMTLGGQPLERRHAVRADEPEELLGSDTAPNPQELLFAALNACMTVGYVAAAAVNGVQLRSLRIVTRGELDLRGFLDLAEGVAAGCESLDVKVEIAGDGTPEQFRAIHEHVRKTSPNVFHIGRAIALDTELVVAS